MFVVYAPNLLGHPDNYIQSDSMKTPPHIVPEWYFLPFYAILRSIPNKLGGVVAMGGAIFILAILPFVVKAEIKSHYFKQYHKTFFWLFVFTSFILGWIGGQVPEEPYVLVGQLATLYYFSYFILFRVQIYTIYYYPPNIFC